MTPREIFIYTDRNGRVCARIATAPGDELDRPHVFIRGKSKVGRALGALMCGERLACLLPRPKGAWA